MTDESLNLTIDLAPPATGKAARTCVPLAEVDCNAWEALCHSRVEGNGFFDPAFALPAFTLSPGGRALQAFASPQCNRLTAILPVVSAWRLLKLPMPVLVARQPYSVLSTPLLDKDDPIAAAGALIEAAGRAGAAVLMIPDLPLDGAAAAALRAAMERRGLNGTTDNLRQRAVLDATVDAEDYLRAGMGAKKLKELRRQSHRMADEGAVRFAEVGAPAEIGAALDRFLALEASGWKGRRGTGLAQDAADAAFIRQAAHDLARRENCSLLELWLDQHLLASGIVIRQGDHALFFKIAFDEAFSRFSPGVQLTVELTRRLCADPEIRFVDSTAVQGHPMIDHVWRERMAVGDLFIPTGRLAPLARLSIALVIARRRLRERAKSFYHLMLSFREKRR
ncbi:MAG: GNAT family N-acetyltransferase [Devosia sp.]